MYKTWWILIKTEIKLLTLLASLLAWTCIEGFSTDFYLNLLVECWSCSEAWAWYQGAGPGTNEGCWSRRSQDQCYWTCCRAGKTQTKTGRKRSSLLGTWQSGLFYVIFCWFLLLKDWYKIPPMTITSIKYQSIWQPWKQSQTIQLKWLLLSNSQATEQQFLNSNMLK